MNARRRLASLAAVLVLALASTNGALATGGGDLLEYDINTD